MKLKPYLIVLVLLISGCDLFGPTRVAKNWFSYVEDAQYDKAFALLSSEYVKATGVDTIKENMQGFHQLMETDKQENGKVVVVDSSDVQTMGGDKATVHLLLRGGGKNNTVRMTFIMVKENGSWKIGEFQ